PLLVALASRASAAPSLDLPHEDWDDLCRDAGNWEYIDGSVDTSKADYRGKTAAKNEFGEKIGLARLEEALEANEWGGGGGVEATVEDEGLDDFLTLKGDLDGAKGTSAPGDFGPLEERLLAAEGMDGKGGRMEGLEQEDEGDEGVEALQSMMLKMQAVRDMGADMPLAERKQLAAGAVREVMKTL
ncbi:MAG: hypothetical protein Q9163_006545, partial [Psora crenata]